MIIREILNTPKRYIRSVNLERDFSDSEVTKSYILTDQAHANFTRIMEGTFSKSGMRAWRITGDYGSGKSSFALVLANIFAGNTALPQQKNTSRESILNQYNIPKLFPILVTGSREPLTTAIVKRLATALDESCPTRKPDFLIELTKQIASNSTIANKDALLIIEKANQYIKKAKKAEGILFILDEMGKHLEYAALNPSEEDLYFLQELGELATRSGDSPIFVLGILHQGFSAYAEDLSIPLQREWDKVSGRFEEIVFHNSIEQTMELISEALGVDSKLLPKDLTLQAQDQMVASSDLDWFGIAARDRLKELGPSLYPLHPLSIPILLALFKQYGQNERSFFSFLFSNEDFGLKSYSHKQISEQAWIRIHNIYDYAKSSFGYKINQNGYKSRWRFISAVIESLGSNSDLEIKILKTIGLINLLERNDLVATEDVVIQSITGTEHSPDEIRIALESLSKRHAIYYRGLANGLCLWPHTSLNLDAAYRKAVNSFILPSAIAPVLTKYVSTRPLVARRHSIETGTLRHFSVRYLTQEELQSYEPTLSHSDGEIVIPLCENQEEYESATALVQTERFSNNSGGLVAIPRPVRSFRNLLLEVCRWEWVSENTPELNNDSFAAEEVSRQVSLSRRLLQSRIDDTLTLRNSTKESGIAWFYKGNPIDIRSGKSLLILLSNICDDFYSQAPLIRNELINRRTISTAAALARNKLTASILTNEHDKLLGLPEDKTPPEMCIYLSMLLASGLHDADGTKGFSLPIEDRNRMRPVFEKIFQLLQEKQGFRIRIDTIWNELMNPPFGVREGVLPLLLAVFLKIYNHSLAMFENGSFLRKIEALDFKRIIKKPSSFELQYLAIEGVKAEVFAKVASVLNLTFNKQHKAALLDVVSPLCTFAAKLPPYTTKTKTVSKPAQQVRNVLLTATDPAQLIFSDLPRACGTQSFIGKEKPDAGELTRYTTTLRKVIDELRDAYPNLLDSIRESLESAFSDNLTGPEFRNRIQTRSGRLLLVVADSSMKGFCQLLSDKNLHDQEWLEAIGSYVCSKPPSKWIDRDKDLYYQKINYFCEQYTRTEAANFKKSKEDNSTSAMRMLITKQDGSEESYVLHLTSEEERLADELSLKLKEVMGNDRKIALAATSRFAWQLISKNEN